VSRHKHLFALHGISSRETETTLMSSAVEVDQLIGATTDWATAASTPYNSSNRFAVLSTDDGDLMESRFLPSYGAVVTSNVHDN